MKIIPGETRIICQNKDSMHGYFGWPTVTRLQDGRLAMVASGFRLKHVCPFGKVVICYSEDEGKTWSQPAIVMDTPLDDRDGGITPFGEQGVVITSFNNSTAFQRKILNQDTDPASPEYRYISSYLDAVDASGLEEKYLGSTFILSHDGGKTFGPVQKAPVSTPHGPTPLPDGRMLYIGRTFSPVDAPTHLESHIMDAQGNFEKLGEIAGIEGYAFHEPHTFILEDGKIIVQIRVHGPDEFYGTYQCESYDGGKTFTTPYQILPGKLCHPTHMIKAPDGTLISTYGNYEDPSRIEAMFSRDGGVTWDHGHCIYENGVNGDLGYPSSVILADGSILTVYYAHPAKDSLAVIMQTQWRFED